ncbi:sugar phosphate isomerase/epimerase family protein [Paenibacillus xerothermodurans]|uniref:Sugar phosphate isomerase/epimerase n=1 Tax=Paenibacillus xerothermodurans TaxID=1977292 RepID=A0A2W1NTZ8_PAEXE|nr:sugar phosphate isomerase/epimerase family protein [Paenibacillus xerothermodurans]PZE22123.1 sugar phosphate isomerase/epimerase [Paenibacillus xerothermodurans]
MKLSFTTLGCPEWDLETIIARAKEYGFDGIDFRGYLGQMNIYKLPQFSTDVHSTIQRIKEAGLEVTCFSSSIKLFATEPEHAKFVDEFRAYAGLCKLFGTRYIRVFGGKIGDTDRAEATRIVVRHLQELSDVAGEHGVKLLIETHDDWTDCRVVRDVLERANRREAAALWDTHHPYRTLGEQPATTWEVLGDWIEYTHWKDSFTRKPEDGGGFQYCPMGQGDIPLQQIYELLRDNNYSGFFTLEWEKKWHPEIEEPELAFPHFVRYMRKLVV